MPLKHKVKSHEQKPGLLNVPMDMTGKLANEYVDYLETIKGNHEAMDIVGADLIKSLKAQGRDNITVRGVTLKVKEIEAKIKISVKRKKED